MLEYKVTALVSLVMTPYIMPLPGIVAMVISTHDRDTARDMKGAVYIPVFFHHICMVIYAERTKDKSCQVTLHLLDCFGSFRH